MALPDEVGDERKSAHRPVIALAGFFGAFVPAKGFQAQSPTAYQALPAAFRLKDGVHGVGHGIPVMPLKIKSRCTRYFRETAGVAA